MSRFQATFIKDPDAVKDYEIDWSDWLQDEEVISTSAWAIVEATPALVIDSSQTSSFASTVWLSAGTDGENYMVTNHILTDQGREDDRTIRVLVREQ